jgi:hypothetical protein
LKKAYVDISDIVHCFCGYEWRRERKIGNLSGVEVEQIEAN